MKERISTGVLGLDQILYGGFLEQKAYLLRGGPGTGKSTLGYRFLEKGASEDESLLITLSESRTNAIANAASMDIDLKGVEILDLSPEEKIYKEAQSYEVFSAAQVEADSFIESIVKKIEKVEPKRVLLDSVSMLQYMHHDPFQYRNMILSFIRYICNIGATVVMISESRLVDEDDKISFWVDGIIDVKYDPGWRRIDVSKFRGSSFQGGEHSLKLSDQGPKVFPRIQPNEYRRKFQNKTLSVGIKEMDVLLKGGIEKGTVNLITGPTGVGKTSLGTQCIKEASLRNERSVIYTFEESIEAIKKRSQGINIDLKEPLQSNNLRIVPVEPFSYSPDEFSMMVQKDIEENDTSFVMIDSIGGFSLSFQEESNPLIRLHTLGVYLQNMGITSIFINEVENIAGDFKPTDINASYLADNIIFLKYIKQRGRLEKAVGVLKKRFGEFENTIRSFKVTSDGLKVGDPLDDFDGLVAVSAKG